MKFAKVKLACLGCKAALSPGEVTLCKHCKTKVRSEYARSCDLQRGDTSAVYPLNNIM